MTLSSQQQDELPGVLPKPGVVPKDQDRAGLQKTLNDSLSGLVGSEGQAVVARQPRAAAAQHTQQSEAHPQNFAAFSLI